MGGLQSACSEGLKKLLMPPVGSHTLEWTGFGEVELDSLLAIAVVSIGAPDSASVIASKRFFEVGLGALRCVGCTDSCSSVSTWIGATELKVEVRRNVSGPWPGQFYIWVEDLQIVWQACKTLQLELDGADNGCEIVREVVCCRNEELADALVLQDPGTGSIFVVNQAPKGCSKKMRDAGLCAEDQTLLCLMDVMLHVPPGSGASVASFYTRMLSAPTTVNREGWRVHFGFGEACRQTLTIKENPDATSDSNCGHQLGIYMPTPLKFKLALAKSSNAGYLSEAARAEANVSHEFSLKNITFADAASDTAPTNPASTHFVEHIVKSPKYAECWPGVAAAAGSQSVSIDMGG